ncbi:MAG: FAD-dependent hydroxylase [Elainellaceae cyanobacterium]
MFYSQILSQSKRPECLDERAPGSTETTMPVDPREESESTSVTLLDYDVVIVGGGIVGLTFAAALQDSGLRLALVEANPREVGLQRRRAYAVTLLSGRIFSGLGIWKQILPDITTFETIQLADAHCGAAIDLKPKDLGTNELGYVAEHCVLVRELYELLDKSNHVTWFCSAQVKQVSYHADGADVVLEKRASSGSAQGTPAEQSTTPHQTVHLRSRLVVAADGSQSPLRKAAGIRTHGWAYWQSCVTAVIRPELSHGNIAREHFWPSGPFATLPLSDNRCQIVLTAPHAEAQRLLQIDKAEFLDELNRRYDHQLGQLTMEGDRFLFPVKLMHSSSYVRHRLALAGDAAHSCHPVGGQGLNMGIRDAASLAQVIDEAVGRGEDIGSIQVLKRYERWRKRENWPVLAFTDVLDRAFSNTWVLVTPLRRLGLRVMRQMSVVKYLALRFMTGLAGRSPNITRHL